MSHKTIQEAGEHLRQAAPNIPARYKAGTSRALWAEKAASDQAETNYQGGIAEAIAKDSRRTGIRATGDVGYRKACEVKGAPVIGQRIIDAIPTYQQEFGGILTAMNNASDASPAKTRDYVTNVNNRLLPVIRAAKEAAGKTV